MRQPGVLLTMLVSLVVAASLALGEAEARQKKDRFGEAIAVSIGAAALAVIAASAANAHRDREHYDYHHGHSSRHNAVSACLHRTHRRIVGRGGSKVTIRKVLSTRHAGDDRWDVALKVRTREANGRHTRNARCSVVHDRVERFAWF